MKSKPQIDLDPSRAENFSHIMFYLILSRKKSTAYSFVLSMNDSELFEYIFSSRVSERSNNTLPSIASVLPKELEIN